MSLALMRAKTNENLDGNLSYSRTFGCCGRLDPQAQFFLNTQDLEI